MRKVFLINEEIRKYLVIDEEAVSHINAPSLLNLQMFLQCTCSKRVGEFYFCLFQAPKQS
jgi:hypothetical protein